MFGKKKKGEKPAPFSFADLFGNAGREKALLAKDQIAELLNTTPEVLEAFEASYRKYKNAVLDRIAEAYPKYVDECCRQKGA